MWNCYVLWHSIPSKLHQNNCSSSRIIGNFMIFFQNLRGLYYQLRKGWFFEKLLYLRKCLFLYVLSMVKKCLRIFGSPCIGQILLLLWDKQDPINNFFPRSGIIKSNYESHYVTNSRLWMSVHNHSHAIHTFLSKECYYVTNLLIIHFIT